ncbi:MAG: T9SS type A sorting domain-containing protein, partial [Raineya sp.]
NGAIVTSWPTSWTGSGQNANITVGSNSYVMRITSASELWNKSVTDVFGASATLPVTTDALIGLGGQFGNTTAPFNTGYQIFVYKLADVLMPVPIVPELNTNAPAAGLDFGDVAKGTFSASQSYKLSGKDLPTTGPNTNTIVNAPNNFQVSKNNTDFASSISFTNAEINAAGTAGLDVFVRFAPNSEIDGDKGGNVTHSVPATTPTISVDVAVKGKQVAAPLSLADELAAQTQIFPNPAGKAIQIKTDRTYQVEMQDVTGRKVAQFNSNESLNVESLPNGLYFLQFKNENIKFAKRLVVQK